MSHVRVVTTTLTALFVSGYVVSAAVAAADGSAEFSPSKIDSVLVTSKDVESLGVGFAETSTDTSDPDRGFPDPGNPCQVAGSTTPMDGFTAFRRVEFDSYSNFTVAEAVAVYPSSDDAKAVILRFVDNANRCGTAGKQFFHADNSQMAWSFPTSNEAGEYTGNVSAWNVQAVDNVVVFATSQRHENGVVLSEKIAGLTAQRVRDAG